MYGVQVGFKASTKICTYFLLSAQRGCVLKTKRAGFWPNDQASTVTDHADCSITATQPPTAFPDNCAAGKAGAARRGIRNLATGRGCLAVPGP